MNLLISRYGNEIVYFQSIENDSIVAGSREHILYAFRFIIALFLFLFFRSIYGGQGTFAYTSTTTHSSIFVGMGCLMSLYKMYNSNKNKKVKTKHKIMNYSRILL